MNTKDWASTATGTIYEGLERQLRDLGQWALAGHNVGYWGTVDRIAAEVNANQLEWRMLTLELWKMDNEEFQS